MRIFDGAHYERHESDSLVLASVFVLLVTVVAFLLDMLVAQLTCANEAVYSSPSLVASLLSSTIQRTLPAFTRTMYCSRYQ